MTFWRLASIPTEKTRQIIFCRTGSRVFYRVGFRISSFRSSLVRTLHYSRNFHSISRGASAKWWCKLAESTTLCLACMWEIMLPWACGANFYQIVELREACINLTQKINSKREAFANRHLETCNCRRGTSYFAKSIAFYAFGGLCIQAPKLCCGTTLVKISCLFLTSLARKPLFWCFKKSCFRLSRRSCFDKVVRKSCTVVQFQVPRNRTLLMLHAVCK